MLPATVHAEEPTTLEIAIRTCVAPGFIPDRDPYELIARLPAENCVRACKAKARGCRGVVRTIDRCGVHFLRAAVKTSIEICRGLGGTPQECRGIREIAKPDIDWWRAAGKQERADCDADMQTLCLSRCPSPVSIDDSIPPPQGPEAPQGITLGAIETLHFIDPLPPTQGHGSVTIVSGPVSQAPRDLEPPQAGAHLGIVAIERTIIPLPPEDPEEDARESAAHAIEFLEE
jgi:hypothetical protein